MIVVDTNIWSETLRPKPDPRVLDWLRTHSPSLYMPVVTVHELRYGIERLDAGRRRADLAEGINAMIGNLRQRVLDYSTPEAEAHATLRAQANRAGKSLSAEDGQILAIALVRGATIATRNTSDFEGYGVPLVNPWLPVQ